jgi:hypothetical protein
MAELRVLAPGGRKSNAVASSPIRSRVFFSFPNFPNACGVQTTECTTYLRGNAQSQA